MKSTSTPRPLVTRRRRRGGLAAVVALAALLGGCDLLGIEPASAAAERRAADGKAVGGACRHAGRAIEDCYTRNPKAERAAVFAGWREMDDHMRENRIEVVAPAPDPAAEDGEEAAAAAPKSRGG